VSLLTQQHGTLVLILLLLLLLLLALLLLLLMLVPHLMLLLLLLLLVLYLLLCWHCRGAPWLLDLMMLMTLLLRLQEARLRCASGWEALLRQALCCLLGVSADAWLRVLLQLLLVLMCTLEPACEAWHQQHQRLSAMLCASLVLTAWGVLPAASVRGIEWVLLPAVLEHQDLLLLLSRIPGVALVVQYGWV
jgi:hypothetical protein